MATRSAIAVKNNDDTYSVVYCHFDGYDNLETLKEFYNDIDKANKLVALGDMSSLGDTIDETIYYNRDRKENWEDVKPTICDTLDDVINFSNERCGEYTLVFENNEWKDVQ